MDINRASVGKLPDESDTVDDFGAYFRRNTHWGIVKTFPRDPEEFYNIQYLSIDQTSLTEDNWNYTWLNYLVDLEVVEVAVDYADPVVYEDLVIAIDFGRKFRDFEMNQPPVGNRVLVQCLPVNQLNTTVHRAIDVSDRPRLDDLTWTKSRGSQTNFDFVVSNYRGTNEIVNFMIKFKVLYVDK